MGKITNSFAAIAAIAVAAVGVLNTSPAAAQYYEGKTITVLIGAGPGSGVTTMGRIMAENLSRSIEGNPEVIVQNMPGGGGAKAQNFLSEQADKDGTTIYYGFWNGIGQVVEAPGIRFNYQDFVAAGGIKLAGVLLWTRKDVVDGGLSSPGGITGVDEFTIGTPGLNGRTMMALLGLEALGLDWKFVGGWEGNGQAARAVASGEMVGMVDAIHVYLPNRVPLLDGNAYPLFHMPQVNPDGSVVANPAMAEHAPSFMDVYREIHGTEPSGLAWEAFKQSLVINESMQHMVIGPPGMDPEAAAALRAGVEIAVNSEAYANDMKNQVIFVPDYVDPDRAAEILAVPGTTSAELRDFYKGIMAEARN